MNKIGKGKSSEVLVPSCLLCKNTRNSHYQFSSFQLLWKMQKPSADPPSPPPPSPLPLPIPHPLPLPLPLPHPLSLPGTLSSQSESINCQKLFWLQEQVDWHGSIIKRKSKLESLLWFGLEKILVWTTISLNKKPTFFSKSIVKIVWLEKKNLPAITLMMWFMVWPGLIWRFVSTFG
jgi:hypothetical protein